MRRAFGIAASVVIAVCSSEAAGTKVRWLSRAATCIAATVIALAIYGHASVVSAQESVPELEQLSPAFVINEWSGDDDSANFLAYPCSVALDEDARIYVLDAGNNRVAVFSPEGRFVKAFGRAGQGPGEFTIRRSYLTADIGVSAERVVVTDPSFRIHLFTKSGEVVDTFSIPRGLQSLAVSSARVYLRVTGVTPETPMEILTFDSDPRNPDGFAGPLLNVGEDRRMSRFNRSMIAVADDGRLMQAYWWFPLLRLHRPGIRVERMVADDWWSVEQLEHLANAKKSLADARQDVVPTAVSPIPFFIDLEYIAATDRWIGLTVRNQLYIFDDEARLERHFELLPAEGDEDFAFIDFGIDRNGQLLCAADPIRNSRVICYRIPEGWLVLPGEE